MKKQLFCITFFLVFCGYIHGQDKQDENTMPVLAWYSIPADSTSVERFAELKEAGFNLHFSHYPDIRSMEKALDMAQMVGIKVYLTCPELKSEPENTVKKFMNHPALAGYYLDDEPTTELFMELGVWARRIEAIDKEHDCYVNLMPIHASKDQLKADSYGEYISRFESEVNMPFISFDHYPVVGDSLHAGWYENLEMIANEAKKTQKPFWAFALSTAHQPYPVPDLAQIRLQMYSNLAYGAQGLQYFTYWTPVNMRWNFYHGPINGDGKRTDVYDRVKEMNKEIQALAGVFCNSKVLSVRHTGETPQGTLPLDTMPSGVSLLETEGTGAVVAELEKGDRRYLVIVNRDFKKSMKLKISFSKPLKRILKDGSAVPASFYSENMVIEPGDALIYMQ